MVTFFGIPISLHDLVHRKIPNAVLVRFLIAALTIKAVEVDLLHNVRDFLVSAIGSFLFLIWFSLCNSLLRDPLGYGDIKLMALLTFILNFEQMRDFIFWLLTIWIFGVISFFAISLKKMRFQGSIALAPAIFMASMTYLAARRWIFLSQ